MVIELITNGVSSKSTRDGRVNTWLTGLGLGLSWGLDMDMDKCPQNCICMGISISIHIYSDRARQFIKWGQHIDIILLPIMQKKKKYHIYIYNYG